MRKFTRKIRALEASRLWCNQYLGSRKANQEHFDSITDQLIELSDATPEQVEEITGNDSWTRTRCSECLRKNVNTVEFNHFDQSWHLCETCLREALKIIKSE